MEKVFAKWRSAKRHRPEMLGTSLSLRMLVQRKFSGEGADMTLMKTGILVVFGIFSG